MTIKFDKFCVRVTISGVHVVRIHESERRRRESQPLVKDDRLLRESFAGGEDVFWR